MFCDQRNWSTWTVYVTAGLSLIVQWNENYACCTWSYKILYRVLVSVVIFPFLTACQNTKTRYLFRTWNVKFVKRLRQTIIYPDTNFKLRNTEIKFHCSKIITTKFHFISNFTKWPAYFKELIFTYTGPVWKLLFKWNIHHELSLIHIIF